MKPRILLVPRPSPFEVTAVFERMKEPSARYSILSRQVHDMPPCILAEKIALPITAVLNLELLHKFHKLTVLELLIQMTWNPSLKTGFSDVPFLNQTLKDLPRFDLPYIFLKLPLILCQQIEISVRGTHGPYSGYN
jgi:hypothetical protein